MSPFNDNSYTGPSPPSFDITHFGQVTGALLPSAQNEPLSADPFELLYLLFRNAGRKVGLVAYGEEIAIDRAVAIGKTACFRFETKADSEESR